MAMRKTYLLALAMPLWLNATAQVNDNNTPLHLMKPEYRTPYGIPTTAEVESTVKKIYDYLNKATPAELENAKTGETVKDFKKITADTRLRQGDFRLTSYEWGVTYSAMMAAAKATGDNKYRDYAYKRMTLLAKAAPYFDKLHKQGAEIDVNVRRVIEPHALDDAGAVCTAMIKAMLDDKSLQLDGRINNYIDFIKNKEHRLADGTFARMRPMRNSVWLDDMFMAIPAIAYMGKYTGEAKYYDEAVKQIKLFADKMFVKEKGLFRHGWVEAMQDHPAYHWGRANGWAILTMCEVLDVLPESHSGRQEILSLLKAHVKGLAALQSADGFWHQLLDRNDTYLETSATAIYAYCIAHAINKGWIDPKVYGAPALLAWNATASKVNAKGQVEGVCVGTGMGFDPAFYAFRPVHPMAAHGYGPTIWAAAEIITLLKNQHPRTNDSAVFFYPEEIKTPGPIFTVEGENKF